MADVRKSVEFTLRAQTGPLEQALKKVPQVTDREAKQMVKKLDKAFDKVERRAKKAGDKSAKSFKKMGKGIAMAGGALVAAGAALFEFTRAIADSVNELQDLSTTTGISVENLHGLRLAASGSGIEMGVLSAGLNKLPSSMQAAAKGSGAAAEAFDRLGVDATNADGSLRDANAVFEEAVSALAGISSEAEKAALAADLFGQKAGAALIQSGAIQGMEAFNALASEFGTKIGPDASAQAALFQRNLATLEEVGMRTGQNLLSAFGGGEGGASMADVLGEISRGLVYMGSIVGDVGEVVSAEFQRMFSPALALSLLLEGKTAQAMETMKQAFSNSGAAIMNMGSSLERANEELQRFDELNAKAQRAGGPGGGGGGGGGKPPGVQAAEAEAAALKEQTDLAKLRNDLDQIHRAAVADTLSEEDKIVQTYNDQIAKINEISAASEGELDTSREREELAARMERDLHELRLSQMEEIDEAEEESHKSRLKLIDKETRARIDSLEQIGGAVISFGSDYATATQELLDNTGKLTEKGAKRIFRITQAAAISEVAMNTAVAIMKSMAQLGPIGGPIAAGLMASLGAVQTAAIATQQPPSFDMGGLVGQSGSMPDEVGAQLLTGEAVLDRGTVRRMGGEAGVRRLQRGEGGGDRVVVVSPFKHFDRFLKSSLRNNSGLRKLQPSTRRGY